jgi:hypothetical protein
MVFAAAVLLTSAIQPIEDFPKYRLEAQKPIGYDVTMSIDGKPDVKIGGQFAILPNTKRPKDWDLDLIYQSDLKMGNQTESKRYRLNLIVDERLWPTAIAGGELIFVEQFLACLMLPTGPSQVVKNGGKSTTRTSTMKVDGDTITLTTKIDSPDQKSEIVQVYSNKLGYITNAKSKVNLKGTTFNTELTPIKE